MSLKVLFFIVLLQFSHTAFGFDCDSVCYYESENTSKPFYSYVSCWAYKSQHCFSRALRVEDDKMMHGNYCGSGRLGDGFHNDPIDDLDKACKVHDKCYHDKGDWDEHCDRDFARTVWDLWVSLKADSANRYKNTELSEKAFFILAGFGGRWLIEDLKNGHSQFKHREDYEKAVQEAISLGLQMSGEKLLSNMDLGDSEAGQIFKEGLSDVLKEAFKSFDPKPYANWIINKIFGSSQEKQRDSELEGHKEL